MENKNLFRSRFHEYYFDIHASKDKYLEYEYKGGLFGKYGITNTPSMLIINGDKEKYFGNDKLFSENPPDLYELIKQEIR